MGAVGEPEAMSTNSYATGSGVMALYSRVLQTAGVTPEGIEIYGDIADGWANGILAGRYTVPFSCGWSPIEPLRSAVLLKWSVNALRGFVTLEDPNWYDRLDRMDQQAEGILKDVVEGRKELVAYANNVSSAFRISPTEDYRTQITSNTKGYVPTMGLVPAEEQHIDSNRLEEERQARRQVIP